MRPTITFIILLTCSIQAAFSQATKLSLGESTVPPSDYPIGVYLMGSESSSPYNWRYDAGVVFGFKPVQSNFRHIQFITHANGSRLALRAKDANNDAWRSWRNVVLANETGDVGIGLDNPASPLHVKIEGSSASYPTVSEKGMLS